MARPPTTVPDLDVQSPVPSDIAIAQSAEILPIARIAEDLGLDADEFVPYGDTKAKIRLTAAERHADRGRGVYVVVAGITPTPLGEGKSTTTVGLCQALGAHVGVPAIAAVRQPSQGPTFGIKGGAAGGGYAQVVPMEEFNLHLTGDIHAISAAHNLVAAAMDARMLHEATQGDDALFRRLTTTGKGGRAFVASQRRRLERLGLDASAEPTDLDASQRRLFARLDLDPETITWRRALDINDRSLRGVRIGLGPEEAKRVPPRDTGFDIAVASELMAILALATDLDDLKRRAARAVVGRSRPDPETGATRPVTVDDLGVAGAVAVLLKDAVDPTLMQTLEGTPVLIHAGPFANVAHGNSSAIADRVGLSLVGRGGAVVTEAGFGADIGFEKFVSIKCRASGLVPDLAVVVATVRALKMHGGAPAPSPGAPLPKEYAEPNPELVRKGCANLARHVRNVRSVGVRCVVAVNVFATDADEELQAVRQAALEAGADAAVECRHHALGGEGAVELANQVLRVARDARDEREQKEKASGERTDANASGKTTETALKHLYPLDASIEEKINAVATKFYGAARAVLSERAAADAAALEAAGLGNLPICMAKTQYSFSNDASLKGAPEGFDLEIREIRPSAGAGFLVAICGTMMMMPGLPTRPAFFDIDITQDGTIVGLS